MTAHPENEPRSVQYVTVDHKLAYRWDGPKPLEVGDAVELPDTGFYGGTWVGRVTALTSSWTGSHRSIIKKLDLGK